jgi:hypothetical protein
MNALRALLTGIVDYAGLFPPALDMPTAVRNYASPATRRRGCRRFVVPVTRLDEQLAAWSAIDGWSRGG